MLAISISDSARRNLSCNLLGAPPTPGRQLPKPVASATSSDGRSAVCSCDYPSLHPRVPRAKKDGPVTCGDEGVRRLAGEREKTNAQHL